MRARHAVAEHRTVRVCLTVALALAVLVVAPAAASAPRIAFSRGGDIFTLRPDGTGVVRVTDSAAREHAPAWSPDHERIAFIAWDRRIVVVDADGTGRRRVFRLPAPFDEVGSLAWSPDGSRIAFATARYTRTPKGWIRDCGQIWWMWADGRNPHPVVWHEPHVTGLSWSPDGGWLAAGFEHQNMTVACGDDRPLGIARVRPDGSDLRALGVPYGTDPDWSPDAAWIVYRDWRRTCHICGEIWLVRPDGSRDHVLVPVPATEGALHHPAYSPAGTRIAAVGEGIVIVRSDDGSVVRRLSLRALDLDW